jgi:hypothetical protein
MSADRNDGEIFSRLGKIEIDVSAIKTMLQEWRKQREDHEVRLRSLGRSRNTGVAAEKPSWLSC